MCDHDEGRQPGFRTHGNCIPRNFAELPELRTPCVKLWNKRRRNAYAFPTPRYYFQPLDGANGTMTLSMGNGSSDP